MSQLVTLCRHFFSFAQSIKDITLQSCCTLNSNYCPGWRDFKFLISLKELATIWCTETSSMGRQIAPLPALKA